MYYLIILFCMALIIGFNILFAVPVFKFNAFYVVGAVFFGVLMVIAVDGLFAFIVRWMFPSKWFTYDKQGFCAEDKESKLLEKLGIKKWKDKVPELGSFTSFRKNKITDPKNNEYVKRYILEANYGVMVHAMGMIFGFLIILFYPLKYVFCFGLPIAIVNLVYNWLSFSILRYNLPKLHKLYRINEKKAKREQKALDCNTADNNQIQTEAFSET